MKKIALLFAVILASSFLLRAVEPADKKEPAVPQIDVPKTGKAPVIDGKLDDECWKNSAEIKALTPAAENADIKAAPNTKVKITWDEDNLYIAFECSGYESTAAEKAGRDSDIMKGDVCGITVSGAGDCRLWYEIYISSSGTLYDEAVVLSADPELNPDGTLTEQSVKKELWRIPAWNGVQKVAVTKITDKEDTTKILGWTAELAIPGKDILKRRGTEKLSPMEIRANFVRLPE
ncbi:MAG: carbohydrate-binding family 9-like protein, partial [Planctomycetes bacterium]|nr:carbohydrate-binding family 9-like protein [Planctomycetota bacterium]